MATGILWSVIIGLWAAYLVPLWIARRDTGHLADDATLEGVDYAGGMDRPAESFDGDGWTGTVDAVDDEVPLRSSGATSRRRRGTRVRRLLARRRARLVARRRRTLFGLVITLLVIVVAVPLGPMPGWSAVAGALVLGGYIVHLRYQARQVEQVRHRVAQERRASARGRRTAAEVSGASPAAAQETRPRRGHGDDDAAAPRAGAPDAVQPHAGRSASGEPDSGQEDAREPVGEGEPTRRPRPSGLWQPLPVPLPTYVTKPKAVQAGHAAHAGHAAQAGHAARVAEGSPAAWSSASHGSDIAPRWHAAPAGTSLSLGVNSAARAPGFARRAVGGRAVGD